ncbi:S26 family signal peptidase [Bailinhaonella thermotolerans]|uniref:S26 family signal peptidase n=2 Tax=Bailinhaonella thermotolerans TaxID=1070861 RepID=A0A3A4AUU6_9ACTN|nr:S26 family signal peptidase [Bailinhaonella thermotolerans]
MRPGLRPGDQLLVRRDARVRDGDVVVARSPEDGRLIVKRVTHREDGGWWLESDNQDASGRRDSWDFGAVPESAVVGKVVWRYWPPRPAVSRRRAR